MTQLIGAALPVNILEMNEDRLLPEWARLDSLFWIISDDPWDKRGFANGWWPRSSLAIGDPALDYGLLEAVWQDSPELTNGQNSRVTITGVTRDVYGSPLGGCTVKLFKTDDGNYPGTKDTKLDETVSDPSGNYTLTTPYYPDQHYVVVYKAGAPDVFGSSPNVLIGSA